MHIMYRHRFIDGHISSTFERLAADDITSFEIETNIGVTAVISDDEEISVLTDILRRLTVLHNVDAQGETLASYSIYTQDGKNYELAVYDGLFL